MKKLLIIVFAGVLAAQDRPETVGTLSATQTITDNEFIWDDGAGGAWRFVDSARCREAIRERAINGCNGRMVKINGSSTSGVGKAAVGYHIVTEADGNSTQQAKWKVLLVKGKDDKLLAICRIDEGKQKCYPIEQ